MEEGALTGGSATISLPWPASRTDAARCSSGWSRNTTADSCCWASIQRSRGATTGATSIGLPSDRSARAHGEKAQRRRARTSLERQSRRAAR